MEKQADFSFTEGKRTHVNFFFFSLTDNLHNISEVTTVQCAIRYWASQLSDETEHR